jgi:hypothetical protein
VLKDLSTRKDGTSQSTFVGIELKWVGRNAADYPWSSVVHIIVAAPDVASNIHTGLKKNP